MHTIVKKIFYSLIFLMVPILAAAETPPAASATPAATQAQKTPAAATGDTKPAETAPASKQVKIGYADMIRIAEETLPGKALQGKLKAKKDKLQAKIDGKRKQLDKQRSNLEAKLPTLTQAQREAKYREFQKKVEEFQKMGKESEEELAKLQEDEGRLLYNKIEQAAEEYGKSNGFDLIIIKKEVLYVGNGVDAQDVTPALVKMLNEGPKK